MVARDAIKMKNKETMIRLREGTLLWLKINLIIILILGFSYFLSKTQAILGFFFYIYVFIFAAPGIFIEKTFSLGKSGSYIIAYLILPVYLLIAVNYLYLYNKNKTIWWLTVLFVVSTILYIIGILAGWFIFLVWHP